MDMHQQVFIEEATELLEELEHSLLVLEETPDDNDVIGRVFRAMHTIKGSGAMFGFDNIAKFTHEVETVFDLVREGKLLVTENLINLTLNARDKIRKMLAASTHDDIVVDQNKVDEIVKSLKKLVTGDHPEEHKVAIHPKRTETYHIHFRPDRDLFSTGTNPVLLLNELRELGKCKIVGQSFDIPELADIDPEACYLSWDIKLKTEHNLDDINGVFIFVEDSCTLTVDVIEDDSEFNETDFEEVSETSVDEQGVIEEKQKINKPSENNISSNEPEIKVVNNIQKQIQKVNDTNVKKNRVVANVKVPSEKLDTLVDLVGELVTVQARLYDFAGLSTDTEIIGISEQVERLTEELRDNTMSLRMLPIGTIFNKFKRLVRDLSSELGRDVEMVTEGADTELDKTVIEQLNDPLVHLIRNSIDHGIEPPDIRKANGKPAKGTVKLSATHSGASVLISIEDNGAGLNADAIREKAIEKGIISPDIEYSEKEIFAQIVAPGFSTAKTISNVSGRGVGMDVVKKTIDALGGNIDISSKQGVGTTITLKLPLTLAIIEGLLVKLGDDSFVFPLSLVEECIELTSKDKEKTNDRHIINVRDTIVSYIPLRERFKMDGNPPQIEQIVITDVNEQKMGFVVDEVIGKHQTVIKNLSKIYKDVEGLSGATILGDGSVALILDVPKLIENAMVEELVSN